MRCLIFSVGHRIRLDTRLDPHCSEILGLLDCMPAVEFWTMSSPSPNEDAVPLCNHPRAFLTRNVDGTLDWQGLFSYGDGFDAILVPSQCHINAELLQGIEYASQQGLELFALIGDPRPAYWQYLQKWHFTYIIASTANKAQAEAVLGRACLSLPWELEAGKYVLKGRALYKTHKRLFAFFQKPDEYRAKLIAKYSSDMAGIGPTLPLLSSITGNLRIDNGQELADFKSRAKQLFYCIGKQHINLGYCINIRCWDGIANNAELAIPEELAFCFSKQQLLQFNGVIIKG